MFQVSASISDDNRIPWVDEPKCADCHTGIPQVDSGSILYRNARGHGNLHCATCHGSPHAMTPSSLDADNYQAVQYQNVAKAIGSCGRVGVCHDGSRGEDDEIDEFMEKHGGPDPEEPTACNVCHTAVASADTTLWPHEFQWKNR
jgi:hypothetical protein